jgi:hypothetical protein
MGTKKDRNALITKGIKKEETRGIEIGPWMNPLVPKKEGWNTIVVDYTDAETLKENARQLSHQVAEPQIENIEEVDIIWEGGSLQSLLSQRGVSNLDYFVSSHNIEHSVDLIDHLKAAEAVIADRGIISMAVPDMRYTFDFFRAPSSVADALRVHRYGLKIHEPESLLDQQLNSIQNNGAIAWTTQTAIQDVSYTGNPITMWDNYKSLQDSITYQDCHRWCFVPASFELLLFDLRWMGLLNLRITSIRSAEDGILGSEFLVQLKKIKKGKDNTVLAPELIQAKRMQLQFTILKQQADRLRIPQTIVDQGPARRKLRK